MALRMVCLAQKPVALSNNQFSAFQFIQDLARRENSSSFFVADLGKVHLLVSQWIAKLPRVRPFYSLDCNRDDTFLRVLSSYPQVGFLHCSSRQQLDVALDFVEPDCLFYSNPCWTRSTLSGAKSNGVALLGFDSESDLTRMAANGITNKLILNVCMDSVSGDPIGCEISKAPELLQLASALGLDCVGVGFFNLGGQRPALFDSMIECAAQLFTIGRALGLNMSVLNLGGGFPSILSAQHPSFEQICEQVNLSLDYYFPEATCPDVQIIATPGRFFASPIFALATKIVDKTEVSASQITNDDFDAGQRGFIYKINEGYYGPFGCRIMPNCAPKCLPLFSDLTGGDPSRSELIYGSVLGPDMDQTADVVQPQCQFREMCVDEWLLWPNMGAYSMNNCASLDDDEPCSAPEVFYFSRENDWKFAEESSQHIVNDQSDGESELSDDSAIDEEDDDPLWMFDGLFFNIL